MPDMQGDYTQTYSKLRFERDVYKVFRRVERSVNGIVM